MELCIDPFKYQGRPSRYVVDYHKIPINMYNVVDISSKKIRPKDKTLINSESKKRVSYLLPSNMVYRCQFSPKLITDDPEAEVFKAFIVSDIAKVLNKPIIEVYDMIESYVMDEKGLDIPLIPGTADLPKPEIPYGPVIAAGLIIGLVVISTRTNKKD